MNAKSAIFLFCGGLLGLVMPEVVWADAASRPVTLPTTRQVRHIGRPAPSVDALRAFFSKEAPRVMKKFHIVGATLSVVLDGKVVLLKGYGHKDLKRKHKIDPNKTLFRIGSVSKLFTWMSVLQLVEEGKIALDKDLREYIPKVTYSRRYGPITMAQLMTHTPGFEDVLIGLFSLDPKKARTLEQALLSRPPMRVLPPGQQIAYSNYGTSLAGYVVQQVSGMPFETYVEKKILSPLRMKYATFRQLPKPLMPFMSDGFSFIGTDKKPQWKKKGFEYIWLTPAGSFSASAGAMAKFMLATLQRGQLNGRRIFGEKTAKAIHRTHFRMHPAAAGYAHGFIEIQRQQPRVLGHFGDTIFFHSLYMLFPAQKMGVFFSTNTDTGMRAYWALKVAFMKRFFPGKTGKQLTTKKLSDTQLKEYIGHYSSNRRSASDATKIMGLFTRTVVTKGTKPSQLKILDFMSFRMIPTVMVAPDVFQDVSGTMRWVFLRNKQGRVYGVFGNAFPVMTFVRTPWFESFTLTLAIVISFLMCFLLGLVIRPTGLLVWLWREEHPRGEFFWASLSGAIVLLGYLVLFIAVFFSGSEDFIFTEPSPWLYRIPFISLFGSVGMLFFAFRSWWLGWWGWLRRLFYTLFATPSLAFLWLLSYWKVMLW